MHKLGEKSRVNKVRLLNLPLHCLKLLLHNLLLLVNFVSKISLLLWCASLRIPRRHHLLEMHSWRSSSEKGRLHVLLRCLSHALESGGLLLAHELVLRNHLASLGRNWLESIEADHPRRLIHL